MMVANEVTIKGMRDGLLITLGDGDLADLLFELADRLQRTASFFQGGRVTLAVGSRALSRSELQAINDVLVDAGVHLRAVVSTDQGTLQAARGLGIKTATKTDRPAVRPRRERAVDESRTGLLVRRTLRSGQTVRNRGHVVILGDVNPGAEVVAGGDVVVWGRLRGLVHAGAMGDDGAVVCALVLAPTQLRIGNHIARPPDDKRGTSYSPEVARVQGSQIVVEAWK